MKLSKKHTDTSTTLSTSNTDLIRNFFIDEQYGARGNETRESFERGFGNFKQDILQPQSNTHFFPTMPRVAAML